MPNVDQAQREALDPEIMDLMNKQAVQKVESGKLVFTSPMFVVPKKGGKWRSIIHLPTLRAEQRTVCIHEAVMSKHTREYTV